MITNDDVKSLFVLFWHKKLTAVVWDEYKSILNKHEKKRKSVSSTDCQGSSLIVWVDSDRVEM